MKKIKLSLAEKFPILPFALLADKWLLWAKEKTVFQQLYSRKISEICIQPMLSTAGLGIVKETGKFCVYFNEYCKAEWAMGGLGHELAHTFHFDITQSPPVKTIDDQSREFFYDFDEEGEPQGFLIEDFCDEFARRWLCINTREKVRLSCKGEKNVLAAIILMFSNLRSKEYTT